MQNLDPRLMMWYTRRNLDPKPMPDRRSTIQFLYPEVPQAHRTCWLTVAPEKAVDLCSIDPGFEVNLFVSSDLKTMTAIWMGLETVRKAVHDRHVRSLCQVGCKSLTLFQEIAPMSKGYWIAHVDVADPEKYKDYVAANATAFRKYGARFLVRGGSFECVEGHSRLRNVVIEFPSYQSAIDCYRSPEYEAARERRLQASTIDLIIVDGYDGPQPAGA